MMSCPRSGADRAVCWRQREQIRPTVFSSVWKGEFGVLCLWHRILDRDPLYFIKCQFILPSVVELGRLRRFVTRHPLGLLQRPAVGQGRKRARNHFLIGPICGFAPASGPIGNISDPDTFFSVSRIRSPLFSVPGTTARFRQVQSTVGSAPGWLTPLPARSVPVEPGGPSKKKGRSQASWRHPRPDERTGDPAEKTEREFQLQIVCSAPARSPAGRVRRACDDAPLSFPVRLCDAPYLLLPLANGRYQ